MSPAGSPADSGIRRKEELAIIGTRALLGLGALAASLIGLKVVLDVIYVPRSEFIPLREQVQFMSSQVSEVRADQRTMQSTLSEIRDAVVRRRSP